MPLLTINSTRRVAPEKKEPFIEAVAELYVDVMDSEPRFLSVRFRAVARENLWLGRAENGSDVVVLEADIRAGRPPDQRRAFALQFMEKLHVEWGIPQPNMKIVFTEHEGSQMMGYDRVGDHWTPADGE